MSKKQISTALLVIVIAAVVAAVATLLPIAPSRNPDLGYSSWCPIAPISTALLLVTAGVLWVIRQYVRTRLG